MSLRKYQAFVETVRLGSLTRAAQSLGSTQSRISHILSDLEEEFGLPLLNRSRSGIQLTQAGTLLLPRMQAILQEDSALQTLARDIRQADAGTIRLGAFTSVAVHWLPGIIRDFQARHPRVELKLFNGDYADMERWLEKGEIDVGFVTLPAPGPVRTIPLAQDPLVVILPRGHRLCALEAIPPEELRNIFKRFYRSKKSLDTQGIGLGLPLAKSIVEGQGGTISVQSEIGAGTTFVLSFPR